ncbi:hypothetical protein SAMN06295964_2233 [Aeromicrobium choanae]|uniref:Uncharacterized protein n=1 Tax=Aeromicrobium choanae TaxID=1736691 RepID=A0A1T4Z3G9_9ACTN|nr:hypothetical protein SAMN06295964_2233 [Aeromicrobium choanae]
MTGPFEIVGDEDAPTCVDGVCAIEPATAGADEEQEPSAI